MGSPSRYRCAGGLAGERWFIVGSGLSFLGLLGVAFFSAAVRPAAIYPSPFWPWPRIKQFFAENSGQVRALGAVHPSRS